MSEPDSHPEVVADELRRDEKAARDEQFSDELEQTERLTNALSDVDPDE